MCQSPSVLPTVTPGTGIHCTSRDCGIEGSKVKIAGLKEMLITHKFCTISETTQNRDIVINELQLILHCIQKHNTTVAKYMMVQSLTLFNYELSTVSKTTVHHPAACHKENMNGLNLHLHRHLSSGHIIQYIIAFTTISV